MERCLKKRGWGGKFPGLEGAFRAATGRVMRLALLPREKALASEERQGRRKDGRTGRQEAGRFVSCAVCRNAQDGRRRTGHALMRGLEHSRGLAGVCRREDADKATVEPVGKHRVATGSRGNVTEARRPVPVRRDIGNVMRRLAREAAEDSGGNASGAWAGTCSPWFVREEDVRPMYQGNTGRRYASRREGNAFMRFLRIQECPAGTCRSLSRNPSGNSNVAGRWRR